MLSRHAEHLFWTGRYVERAADTARMLDVTYHGLLGEPVAESGGYGLCIGPSATDEELAKVAAQVEANPRGYIAQEVVSLSRHPTLVDDHLEGRHVDLRPFVLTGETTTVIPGGLTRVALRRGSLVVNSSQGGGSKDTWVLREDDAKDEDDD